MISVIPKETKIPQLHQYILGAISPRPIAFVSTVDAAGRVNLAPYSFFNAVGSNPATVMFSPARSGRENKTKDTLDNILETKEAVVNIVHHGMVQQMSLASSPYEKGVNEFEKAGFTAIPSEIVKPPRVAESHVQMECLVRDVIQTGDKGGAGNIVVAEIQLIHVDEAVLDENGKIDPYKMDYVARMGGNYYCHVIPESIFELIQPKDTCGLGVDKLPEKIRLSSVLTGNHLGALGSLLAHPSDAELAAFKKENTDLIQQATSDGYHTVAASLLDAGRVQEAFCLLLCE
jgi:flavin reductase (DIM6/NTAB) family NADH-FMN oxidoreductase RutF